MALGGSRLWGDVGHMQGRVSSKRTVHRLERKERTAPPSPIPVSVEGHVWTGLPLLLSWLFALPTFCCPDSGIPVPCPPAPGESRAVGGQRYTASISASPRKDASWQSRARPGPPPEFSRESPSPSSANRSKYQISSLYKLSHSNG